MSKRSASSNLNQDNWNDEDPPEEMGMFQRAAASDLKHRAIKKARRRGMTSEGEKVSVFKNFTAFAPSKTESSTPSFSFLTDEGEKPKLSNPNPFPSFNLSNVNSQAKLNSDVSSSKTLPSSGNLSFSFTSTSNSDSTPEETKSTSSSKANTITSMTFGKASNEGSSKPFDLNPPKDLDSFSKPSGGSMFKFGITSKEDSSAKTSSEPMFQFGSNSKESGPLKTTSSTPTFQFGFSSNNSEKNKSPPIQSNSSLTAPKSPKVNGTKSNSTGSSPKNSLFLANLKALNIGVVNWVKQHVDKNQYINLTPIFEDYKKHFEEIKKKYEPSQKKPSEVNSQSETVSQSVPSKDNDSSSTLTFQNKTSSNSSIPTFESSAKTTSKSETFSFGVTTSVASSVSTNGKANQTDKIPEVQPFSFGLSKSGSSSKTEDSKKSEATDFLPKSSAPVFSFGSSDSSKPGFSFGSGDKKATFSFGSSDSSSKSSGFSFGVAKDSTTSPTSGFSFKPDESKNSTKDEDSKDATTKGEASDDVPKVEVTEVKEDDAFYEKKVKLFYKKDNAYVDRGVGTLFLKRAGDKTQLLIRALTNLGNILLNIILNDSIPTQRVGKNNVLIVCVPNPPIDPNSSSTPVSMLIRVKTGEDADELLKTVDEHKQ